MLEWKKYVPEFIDYGGSPEMLSPSPTQMHARVWSRGTRVILDPSLARLDFSPDGRFFLAAPAVPYENPKEASSTILAWDTHDKREVRMEGGLGDLRHGSSVYYLAPEGLQYFVFVTPDRVMISSMQWARRGVVTARLTAFPSGRPLLKVKLRPGPLSRAADPGFVIVHPFAQYPPPPQPFDVSPAFDVHRPPAHPADRTRGAIAVEIATGHLITSETHALDVPGSYYVAEPSAGVVGLYERGKGLVARVDLHEK